MDKFIRSNLLLRERQRPCWYHVLIFEMLRGERREKHAKSHSDENFVRKRNANFLWFL